MKKYLHSWQSSWIIRNKSSTNTIRPKHCLEFKHIFTNHCIQLFQGSRLHYFSHNIEGTSNLQLQKKKCVEHIFRVQNPLCLKNKCESYLQPLLVYKLTFVHANSSFGGCKQMWFAFFWVQLEKSAESLTLKKSIRSFPCSNLSHKLLDKLKTQPVLLCIVISPSNVFTFYVFCCRRGSLNDYNLPSRTL